jgi:hypothetical protein
VVLRLRTEKTRFSFSETLLVIIVAVSLGAGIYGMINLLKRNDRADAALVMLSHIQQNFADVSDDNHVDSWGNPIAIVSTAANFSVTFSAVPPGACKYIAKNFERTDPAFISLAVNSTIFRENAEEINADTIASACTEKENAMMIWTFSSSL